ncbi:MAG: hypothetical protein ACI4I7_04225 [Oscillospiraceae bacterium]
MSILKKTTALLSAVMLSATLIGCSDTSYVLKADGNEVKAGVYISYLSTELQNQIYSLQQEGITSDYFSQKVDDKELSEYVADVALNNTKEFAAINAEFDKLGLKLDEETTKSISSSITDTWSQYQETYEKQGISKDSLKNISRAAAKRQAIFDYYYAEGGKEAVSDKDMINYVNDNYIRYKVLSVQKTQTTDDSSSTEDEAKTLYEKYLKEAKTLDFDSFDQVIDEYNEYQQAQQEESEADSATDETTTADQENSVETYEAEGEDESVAEVSEDENTDSSADESQTEDKYTNEQMSNYATVDEDSLDTTYGKVLTMLKDMKTDVADSYEDDYAYYIFIKGEVSERSEDYITDEDTHSTILSEMKEDDFQKKINDLVKKITFDINDKAIERYSAENVYNKQNESDE